MLNLGTFAKDEKTGKLTGIFYGVNMYPTKLIFEPMQSEKGNPAQILPQRIPAFPDQKCGCLSHFPSLTSVKKKPQKEPPQSKRLCEG